MTKIRPTLIIEDCSALGQISMVAATTVLQAMGLTTALLPTVLLSTQTEGFGAPARLLTTDWMRQASAHWQRDGVVINSALVGYLGDPAAVKLTSQLLRQLAPSLVVIDPAMADRGQLYPGLAASYPQSMQELCRRANVITPNWTELCLLAGMPVTTSPTVATGMAAASAIKQQGIDAQLVVTGIVKDSQIGYWLFDHGQVHYRTFPYYPGHFYGTGDTFSALLSGYLARGLPLAQAVNKAGEALSTAVRETSHVSEVDRRYGMRLPRLLKFLTREQDQDGKTCNN